MIGILIELFWDVLDALYCTYFIAAFVGASGKRAVRLAFIFGAGIFALTAGMEYIVVVESFVIKTVILFAFSLVYAFLICGGKYLSAFVAACIYKAVIILVSSTFFFVFSLFVPNFSDLMQGGDNLAVRTIAVLIMRIIQFALLSLALVVFKKGLIRDRLTGVILFIITSSTIVGGGSVLFSLGIDDHSSKARMMLIVAVVFFVLNFAIYFLVYRVQKFGEAKYELKLLQERFAFEEQKYAESAEAWDRVRKVRHDMKNHLAAIDGLLAADESGEAREYIAGLIPDMESAGIIVHSDDPVLDYLINSKLAPLKNTEVVVSGSAGSFADVAEKDLVCLVGNILDNAVEAVEKCTERRIELYFSAQNDSRIILCKNTVAATVLAENPSLETTKRDKSSHGFGHRIVETIAKSYGGFIDYYEENGMFCVQILLPIK